MMTDNSDKLQEIINGCKKGNNKAQKQLYEMFCNSMMALCMRYLGNKMDAEDVLIEGFLTIYKNINKFKGGNIFGWIRKVFVNQCLNFLRKDKYLVFKDNEMIINSVEKVVIETNQRFTNEEIMNTLNKLPKSLKTIFNLYIIDGYSQDEICQILNIEKITVKTSVYKAKIILREELLKMENHINNE